MRALYLWCQPAKSQASQANKGLISISGSREMAQKEWKWDWVGMQKRRYEQHSIFRAYSTEIDLFLPRGAILLRFMTDSTSNESGWRMGGVRHLLRLQIFYLSNQLIVLFLSLFILCRPLHCEHHMCTAPEAPTVHCLCASLGIWNGCRWLTRRSLRGMLLGLRPISAQQF